MSNSCTFHHEQQYLEVIANGPITLDDVRAHLVEERREHGLAYSELIDARWARVQWTSAQAREIVALLKTLAMESPLGPTALVVDRNRGANPFVQGGVKPSPLRWS